ncbi:hyaluronan and proteoglycan link protein 3 [Callorhinchus milii]|uniref:Hyaluronan and proteoglycan link protein 3 n=1 Tax=Callorhinchus milii TaxID=7868 RepID=V9KV99_CALMI|nr:hyaluronan and proteoglycan link protein 3 [Callorhinchus milii]|eukprot:gi/632979576/ref/XP_007906547.1/ PREDICTED: hyaluronan and proteoglycan link protein 3 [Callorhinchus milii]
MLAVMVAMLPLLCLSQCREQNGAFYFNGNGNGEYFNGVKLHIEAPRDRIFAYRGENVTLTCRFHYQPELNATRKVRVKWTKLNLDFTKESDVMVAIGLRHRSFGEFKGRVYLRQRQPREVSLVIADVRLEDYGKYKCEVIDGLEDESSIVELELRGVVFPYQPRHGRYQLNFHEAKRACEQQDAMAASFEQLFQAWEEGLDWCNAGWLADGSVQYPITAPREPCGGKDISPGVRSYGQRHKDLHRFDVFCFASTLKGTLYLLQRPGGMSFSAAVTMCEEDGGQIAKVGQLFAAWKFLSFDRCQAGWLADGSVRYPIAFPRPNCGPSEPGVRTFGFPGKEHGRFGVFCHKTS